MEDKEIERRLKESVEKIKMKDFEERWEAISDRIEAEQSCECSEKIQSAVLVTSTDKTISDNKLRKRIIYLLCGFCVAVALCLAITLPIVLGKNKEPKRYLIKNLTLSAVTETEFNDSIAQSDLSLIDLSDFELNYLMVYYTTDNKLVGGRVEATEVELGAYIEMIFYTNNVMSDFDVGTEYNEYKVNGYKVIYSTENVEEFCNTKAKATKANMVYELTITSGDDNLESLFDKLFS